MSLPQDPSLPRDRDVCWITFLRPYPDIVKYNTIAKIKAYIKAALYCCLECENLTQCSAVDDCKNCTSDRKTYCEECEDLPYNEQERKELAEERKSMKPCPYLYRRVLCEKVRDWHHCGCGKVESCNDCELQSQLSEHQLKTILNYPDDADSDSEEGEITPSEDEDEDESGASSRKRKPADYLEKNNVEEEDKEEPEERKKQKKEIIVIE